MINVSLLVLYVMVPDAQHQGLILGYPGRYLLARFYYQGDLFVLKETFTGTLLARFLSTWDFHLFASVFNKNCLDINFFTYTFFLSWVLNLFLFFWHCETSLITDSSLLHHQQQYQDHITHHTQIHTNTFCAWSQLFHKTIHLLQILVTSLGYYSIFLYENICNMITFSFRFLVFVYNLYVSFLSVKFFKGNYS